MTDLVPVRILDEATRAVRLAEVFVAARRTEHTRTAYRRDLVTQPSGWLPWCVANGVDPFDARSAHVQMWLRHLEALGEADGTRARRLSTTSSWYAWLIRQEAAHRNPADLDPTERPKPRTGGTSGIALSERQAGAMLAAADNDSLRNAALVALLLFTGLRVSEAANATLADLGQDRGHRILTVRGKGGKHRIVPLAAPVCDRLDAYLAARTDKPDRLPARAGHATQLRPLLATATGRPLDRSYIARLLCRLAVAAGVADKVTPHDLRRSFITLSLDAGVPLRDVQDAAGHADPRTTRRYDRSGLNPDRHPAYRLAGIVQPRPLQEHTA